MVKARPASGQDAPVGSRAASKSLCQLPGGVPGNPHVEKVFRYAIGESSGVRLGGQVLGESAQGRGDADDELGTAAVAVAG
ncbi:MAG: hypothetical protein RJA63_3670, partial [Pseudomonadota bacterium]